MPALMVIGPLAWRSHCGAGYFLLPRMHANERQVALWER